MADQRPGPPIPRAKYNQSLNGVYGEFGSGAGLQAFYLQSAITPGELDRISLISDIPGAERWPIRDLFQREVDHDRVHKGLLPYLRDPERIRFFNPLTLTVLPTGSDGSVLNTMPRVVEHDVNEDGFSWKVLERDGFFRIRWIDGHQESAQLQWNDSRTELVAIDGQHRLSALKEMAVDYKAKGVFETFMGWRIPIVFVSFRVRGDRNEPPSVLEVVRSIFVYINTNAQRVNKTRAILLDDEDANAVCTQEVLQYSHGNDVSENPKPGRIPLLFYDWRGEERWNPRTGESDLVRSPSAVKGVEEIYDWFSTYLLGSNFSQQQQNALHINLTHKVLYGAFYDKSLSHEASNKLRERFREEYLPGFIWLLENFNPYREYIDRLGHVERESLRGSNIDRHAFEKLRFGTSTAIRASVEDVDRTLATLIARIEGIRKDILTSPINQDVGMRGIMWAFANMAGLFPQMSWVDYSKWFTQALNKAYESSWLQLLAKSMYRRHLRHIIEDHNGTIVNYRLEDAQRAFGPYVAILVGGYGHAELMAEEAWPDFLDEQLGVLEQTLVRGYRKEVRPQLRREFPDGGRALTEAVNKKAAPLARTQKNRFNDAVERLMR